MNKIFCLMPILTVIAGMLAAVPAWAQTPLVLPLSAVNMPAANASLSRQTDPIFARQDDAGNRPAFPPPSGGQYQFTKIRIQHYDAGVIADLITRPAGIIAVPPNFVIPASVGAAVIPPKAAPNVLPEGVRRIFVLESDNSLVIEATPDGLASLSR